MSDRINIYRELLRPARKNFPRRKVRIRGIDDLWVSDLLDLTSYKYYNNNNKFLLVTMNAFSKKVYLEPLKNKSGVEVTRAFSKILQRANYLPKHLQTDQGLEYFNSNFKKLMDEYNITHYHTGSVIKCGLAERLNRTLMNLIYKHFTLNATYNWTDHIQEIARTYNNTYHSKIHTSPNKVSRKNEKEILKNYYTDDFFVKEPKFKVGDFVRLSKHKKVFDKSYKLNWTTEIFRIHKINKTCPITYQLKDYNGEILFGSAYEEELSKTNYPDTYLVEKVLKTRGNQQKVRWLGFPSQYDQWIPRSHEV